MINGIQQAKDRKESKMTFTIFTIVDQVDDTNFTEDKEGGDEKEMAHRERGGVRFYTSEKEETLKYLDRDVQQVFVHRI